MGYFETPGLMSTVGFYRINCVRTFLNAKSCSAVASQDFNRGVVSSHIVKIYNRIVSQHSPPALVYRNPFTDRSSFGPQQMCIQNAVWADVLTSFEKA